MRRQIVWRQRGGGGSRQKNMVCTAGEGLVRKITFQLAIFTLNQQQKAAKGTSARCWCVHHTPSCLMIVLV